MARQKSTADPSATLRLISMAYRDPTPEEEAQVVRLLRKHDALDLVPLLGLQVTNAESSSDTKVAV